MLEPFMLPGIPLWLFWLCVGLGIIIQGVSKSGFGAGAGILSLPLMMLVMPVDRVAATLLPLLVLLDLNAVYHHRRNVVWKKVMEVYLPSIAGIVLGAIVWWWVGREGVETLGGAIKRVVGVIAIFFAIYIGVREIWLEWARRHRLGPGAALIMGAAAGFTSTIAHAAGPIVSLYLFSQHLGKTLFVGTVAWTFLLINVTKVPFYIGAGLIDPQVLRFDLLLLPLIPVGSYLGHWMHHRVNETWFNRIIMVLAFIAGVQLVFNFDIIHHGLLYFVPQQG